MADTVGKLFLPLHTRRTGVAVPSPVRPFKQGFKKMKQPSPNQISGWQTERSKKLQRHCLRIKSAVANGKPTQQTIRRVARSLNGSAYRCEPSRRLALSAKTLRRAWDKWKLGGEVPAAFKLNFNPHRRFIPAPVLVRFAEFCASHRQRSLSAAWRNFSARGGSHGRGRHARPPLKISFYLVSQYFPAAVFYQMQAELKAIAAAQIHLGQLKLKAIADIRARLPDRPPRQRLKRGNTFEI